MIDTIAPRLGHRYRTRNGTVARATRVISDRGEIEMLVVTPSPNDKDTDPGDTFDVSAKIGAYMATSSSIHDWDLMEDLDIGMIRNATLKVEVALEDVSDLVESGKVKVLEVFAHEA